MKRILIIGCSGSGKTTLAKTLSKQLNLPLYHLDDYIWHPGWVQRDFNEFSQEIWDLCAQESWIMDGTYTRTLSARIVYADTIIFLDLSRWLCMWRVVKRYVQLRSQGAEIVPGCPATLNRKFLQYLWVFQKKFRPLILSILESYRNDATKRIYVLQNPAAVASFIQRRCVYE